MVPPHFGKRCGIHLLWEVIWYSPTLRRIWHIPTLRRHMVHPYMEKRYATTPLWEEVWYTPTLGSDMVQFYFEKNMAQSYFGKRYGTSPLWGKIWHISTLGRDMVHPYFGTRYGTVLLSSQWVGVGFILYLLQFHFILWHKVGLLFNIVSCHVFFPCVHFFTRIFIEKLSL